MSRIMNRYKIIVEGNPFEDVSAYIKLKKIIKRGIGE
ncbi:hypothetical protein O163_09515 [Caldanaerobacter subterraneus subsp. yonseiensis KB-1]|uniref:Uncharacterized protein n=1 Tax=Caldanaerobacter subterraneus subsp. yonseiensis KB-1 TaxID=1388761 RepID=U5CPC0_CALSX|nr:hypothetical protein O163_09515 [Caldanaerobacter subterraneus subsp. yonseiensis KB-1]